MIIQSRIFLLGSLIWLTFFIFIGACNNSATDNKNPDQKGSIAGNSPADSISRAGADSLSVFENFIPSGWMGDGKDPGRRWLALDESWATDPHSVPSCARVSYRSGGTNGWAGIYWQNLPNNWCRNPGANFSQRRFTTISFWAKGEHGGEVVDFKAGGISNCEAGGDYHDSFETGTRRITLETTWRQYTIDLSERDLSSVIGGFCWSAPAPTAGTKVFYIDDVYYR